MQGDAMSVIQRATSGGSGLSGDAEGDVGPFVDGEAHGSPNECAIGDVIVHVLVAHPPPHAPRVGLEHRATLPLRVLIADDYADAAESLAMLLASAGVDTEIAMDGEQALERANTWRPHICVLDLEMPKLDGREIARQIREQSWCERPLLIALTGWTAAKDQRSALDAGFDHYVTKPVEPAKLVRIIQDYLDRRAVIVASDNVEYRDA